MAETLDRLIALWSGLEAPLKWGTLGVAASLVLLVFLFAVVRISRYVQRGWRRVLFVVGCVCVAFALVFGIWASALPEPERVSFVLSHQIVRVCAALFGTFSIIILMSLGLPLGLDQLERRSFVSFVAARHVRASKSGFLTVISILSIAGVAISSLALCAVVSIMGGFGADLKSKILGNNAHISIDGLNPNGDADPATPSADAPPAEDTGAPTLPWDDLLDRVRLVPGVVAATPVMTGEAMASSQSNTAGVMIRGVETTSIGSVVDLVKNIEVGDFAYMDEPGRILEMGEDEPIWIGRGGHRYLKGPRGRRTSVRPLDSAAGEVGPEAKAVDPKGAEPKPEPKGPVPPELDPDVAEVIRTDDYPSIVLGRELAKTLHVYVGDEITLVSPVGELGPMGVLPRARKFRVAAVFYSGMYEYDSLHAYVTLPVAQRFLDRPGIISQIEVKVEREDRAAEVRERLSAALAGQNLRIRDWQEMNKGLFSALELEKIVTFIILSIAIVVGSFCIICTLLLMVTEKSKEIAILKATGASNMGILKVFMTEGLLIGGIGTVFGVVTGLVLCLGLLWFGVRLDPDVYYVDRLPINVDPIDYCVVALCSLGITVLATIYPALAASRLLPVEGIRYE
jgi:lipoprotein-releasing system permease protein